MTTIGMGRRWVPALGALLGLALAAAQPLAAPSNAGMAPQRLQAFGLTHYYQLAEEPVVGTMVLIHGCGPAARAFFPYDPVNCPECMGLPEYLAQAKHALARGYHVLALQANNVASGCWSSSTKPGFVNDRPHVVAIAADFQRNHSATDLPLYFQGYSSGGTMCLKLPSYLLETGDRLRIDGIVAVDAAPRGGFNAEDGDSGKILEGLDYPPTLFVVMETGGGRERAPEQIDFLRANGVPADMIEVPPRPLTPSWFSDRIPIVTPPQSQELVEELARLGGVGPDGFLLPVWVLDAAAAALPWLTDPRVRDSVVTQLRIASGEHENMGEFAGASLAWLESRGKADLGQLVKELVPTRMADITIDRRGLDGAAAPAAAPASAPVPAASGEVPASAGAPAPAPL